MNNKILISILGKGQYNKELKKSDYQITEYQIEDGAKKESKLVSDIISSQMEFSKVYIVGTEESLWSVADEYLDSYEKVVIPYGKNNEEFWKIFEVLTKLDVENKEIYFDVTHGFRSIPIFVSTLLNFFTKVKNAEVKGVYYGIFEAKENNVTSVVNMLPFLEMNAFVDAFSIFKKYSDGRDIAQIINEKFKEIPNEEKRQYGKLRELAKELEFYSKAIGFSALELYHDSLLKIENKIEDIDKIPNNLKAIDFLMSDLKEDVSSFKELKKNWDRDLKTAELLYERNRYAQSLTILRETVLTYILEELALDFGNMDLREKSLGELFEGDSKRIRDKEPTVYFTKEFIPILEAMRELRNKSNHAFMSKNVGKKDIDKSVENLKKFMKDFRELFEHDEVIKDRDGIKEILNKI